MRKFVATINPEYGKFAMEATGITVTEMGEILPCKTVNGKIQLPPPQFIEVPIEEWEKSQANAPH